MLHSCFESVYVCVFVCVRSEGGGWMTSDSKWTEEGGKIPFLSTGNSIYLKKKV